MSHDYETQQNFVCPSCHAEQALPVSPAPQFPCAHCGITLQNDRGETPPPEPHLIPPVQSPAQELFPEQQPVDHEAAPLLEDRSARGRFARKRKDDAFIGRLKTVDEEEKVRWKKKKVRPLDAKNAHIEENWEENDGEFGGRDAREPSRSKVLPMFAIGALAIAALVVAVISFNGVSRGNRGADQESAPETAVPVDYEAARQAMKNFLDAESVDELVRYIRDPERVAPLARQYYAENPIESVIYNPIPGLEGVQFDGRYLEVIVDLVGTENRPMVLEQIGDDYRIDWESWVGYSEMSWSDFVERRVIEPTLFRVMIGPDTYYNHKFSDPLEYSCLRLQDQAGDHTLYAYVPREGKLGKMFQVAFRKAQFGVAIVNIQFPTDNPSDTLGNQVVISEFISFGWALRAD